jgi:Zn-dependent protease
VALQFDRFTPEAQDAAARAYEILTRYGHGAIDTDHLALALFERPDSSLASLLQTFSIDSALIRQRLDDVLRALPKAQTPSATVYITPRTKQVIEQAQVEARQLGSDQVKPLHLLLAILSDPSTTSASILTGAGLTRDRILGVNKNATGTTTPDAWELAYQRLNSSSTVAAAVAAIEPLPPPTWREFPFAISPVFLGIVTLTAIAAAFTFMGGAYVRFALFVFVAGGWVISLSLHEFGHSVVAFFGGDRSVADKGYLSLDPLKYTHKWLSIVFPLIILAMGGIGLPGGAVYINMNAIRSRWVRSLVSAAGPIMTGICAAVLVVPFFLRLVGSSPAHIEFWSGLAMLAFLQLTALFFNLLPFPGLDGFGIIEPFLPPAILNITYRVRQFTFLIIFVLFFNPTPVSNLFFSVLGVVVWIAGIDYSLVGTGFDLFRFWTG